MANNRSGIYRIECRVTGKIYVGSSKQIHSRWAQHRKSLRAQKSPCRHLQFAWSKYGETAFDFSVLEECPCDVLETREQYYIDTLKPALNCITDIKRRYSAEARAKIVAASRARAALVTHCPLGHEYNEANTYRNAKGKRICRECNKLRVRNIYASETPEEREVRRLRVAEYNGRSREERIQKQAVYAAAHKVEKREYDRLRRERLKQECFPSTH